MSPRRLLLLASGVALMAAPLAGCAGEAPEATEAVATVGDAEITANEFAEAYAQTVLMAGTDGPDAPEAVLNSLISRQLLIQAARDEGVASGEAFEAALAQAETKALVDLYTAREMAPDLQVTEADLKEQFVQANTTYDARHLYARDEAAARRLRQRLLAGETFEALARETFADSTLAASGGSLGAFGHDEMDPAFEAAAFRLPVGEISEPVRTAQGYSVLRVDARATRPLLTEDEFNRRRPQLARYVRKKKRTEARFALSRTVRDDLNPQFDAEAFSSLVAFASGAAAPLDAEALTSWRQKPLVRFTSDVQDGVWTVGEVEDHAAAMTERQRRAVQDAASLQEFIEGLLVREELAARAREAGLDRADRFRRSVALRTDEWIFDEAKRRLRLSIEPDADTLLAHFEAYGEAYRFPERVRASEILVSTRAEADALRQRLASGESFAALAREHSLRLGAATASGDLGLVSREQLGRMGALVFEAPSGAVVGPVEVEGRYALILRGETVPSRSMTFAEARPQIVERLSADVARQRLTETVASLRDRYPVTVHQDALDRILAQIRAPLSTAQRAPASPSDRS